MKYEYELYERRADGVLNWRGVVQGLDSARVAVQLLADDTGNECFAVQPGTRQRALIRIPERGGARVFQIGYGPQIHARAAMLHRSGYDVTCAWGNAAALLMLAARPHYDMFVIGDEAAAETRSQMLDWLRQRYDHSSILALNSPGIPALDPSCVPCEPSEMWLSCLSRRTGRPNANGNMVPAQISNRRLVPGA